MDLGQLREQIDVIDKEIVELYEKRMNISSQVADYKISNGKKVFDKAREQEKIASYLRSVDNLITLHQCKHVQDHNGSFTTEFEPDSM